MFHVVRYPLDDPTCVKLPTASEIPSEIPKEDCLESAALWMLKRRANLPYLPPQRLPAIARVA